MCRNLNMIAFCLLFIIGINKTYSAETSTYEFKWLDPDKEVYVLQNRKFRKIGKLYLNVGVGTTTSGAFADAAYGQVRVGFFFTENWGFEALHTTTSSKTNSTYDSVFAQDSVPFVRLIDSYSGAMFMWSPFYAKINTFDQIFYFDWMFGLGFATLSEQNNRTALNEGSKDLPFESEDHSGVMWATSLRFYMSQHWSLRLDLTTIHYQADKAFKDSQEQVWYDNFDLGVGLSYTF